MNEPPPEEKNLRKENLSDEGNLANVETNNSIVEQTSSPSSKSTKNKSKKNKTNSSQDIRMKAVVKSAFTESENHRERLVHQLSNAQYECMICYNIIRSHVATMHCPGCYHVYHLFCIKQWSRAEAERHRASATSQQSKSNSQCWRCPACQREHDNSSTGGFRYWCFCGKLRDPAFSPHYTPHSCGELCSKLRSEKCSHPCNILCHPGPCPPCEAFIMVTCPCGRTKSTVKCNQSNAYHCDAICKRLLNCGLHYCESQCHSGECEPCMVTTERNCECSQTKQTVVCGSSDSKLSHFTCDRVCNKMLDCGNHRCIEVCHSGPCSPCSRLPELVTHCPCGRNLLLHLMSSGKATGPRESCLSEIPTCSNICGRTQPLCGHGCKVKCHDGSCPPCPDSTNVTCRCGRWTRQLACTQALAMSRSGEEVFCQRRCKKIKSCGLHRCGLSCCIDFDHVCPLQCGKTQQCGNHTCESRCHQGPCPPCKRMNLQGISCHCGNTFLPPPLPCGTLPPQCPYPCARPRNCSHEIDHPCHPTPPECPPCTVLVDKLCPGGHKLMPNIPCYQEVVTCGVKCLRPLPTCHHLCWRACHPGDNCLQDFNSKKFECKQPCSQIRPTCRHTCALPCHGMRSCLEVQTKAGDKGRCKHPVALTCSCGHRKENVVCPKYQEMVAKHNAMSPATEPELNVPTLLLECDSSCLMAKRLAGLSEVVQAHQQQLAAGEGPSSDTTIDSPPYVAFLKEYGSRNLPFVYFVEDEFDKILRSLYESNNKSHQYHFSPQNFDKRRFIHELSDFYQIDSRSYGIKPNRNVEVVAYKNKSFAPTMKLSSVLLRDYPSLKKPPTSIKKTAVLVPMSEITSLTSNMTLLGSNETDSDWLRPSRTSNRSVGNHGQPQTLVAQASHNGWWNALENPSESLD